MINLVWIAGFFDGEGSVHAATTHNFAPRIQIAQNDRKILSDIQDFLEMGSMLVQRKTISVDTHILYIAKKSDVIKFVDLIEPHSIIKKEKLKIARELALTPPSERQELATALDALRTGKKRGRKINPIGGKAT